MSAPVFDPDCEGGERCTCRRAEVLDTPTARLIAAARQCVRVWRPARDSEGDGIVGEMMSALRDLDAAYIDEPVGITADIVVAEACAMSSTPAIQSTLSPICIEVLRRVHDGLETIHALHYSAQLELVGRGLLDMPNRLALTEKGREALRAAGIDVPPGGALVEAFTAGAEYMRQKTIVMGWINHPDQPPVAVQPLAREVEAAAARYMEGLVG